MSATQREPVDDKHADQTSDKARFPELSPAAGATDRGPHTEGSAHSAHEPHPPDHARGSHDPHADHATAYDAHAGRSGSHDAHADHGEAHDTHAGHSVAMFRDKFWVSLLL